MNKEAIGINETMKSNITVSNSPHYEASITEYNDDDISHMIYEIRGQQVMLDFDLAALYGYEVKKLNQQVKRNIERFPQDFMFQLTENEVNLVRSQIVTSPKDNIFKGQDGGRRYLPLAFTEQGVNQLSSVLRGPIAVKQSIHIMRVFVKIRHYIAQNKPLLNYKDLLMLSLENKSDIEKMKSTMATKDDIKFIMERFIVNDKIKEFVFLNGQQFEADELFINLYKQARFSIYIIDNYISIKTLSHLKHKKAGISVVIFTDNLGGKDKLRKVEFVDFNLQYPSLILKPNGLSHDRYIIFDYDTDNEVIYHCGSSIKDAGKKVCTINKLDDKNIFHSIIDTLLTQENHIL